MLEFSKPHFTFICIIQQKELKHLRRYFTIGLFLCTKENKASAMTSQSFNSSELPSENYLSEMVHCTISLYCLMY